MVFVCLAKADGSFVLLIEYFFLIALSSKSLAFLVPIVMLVGSASIMEVIVVSSLLSLVCLF